MKKNDRVMVSNSSSAFYLKRGTIVYVNDENFVKWNTELLFVSVQLDEGSEIGFAAKELVKIGDGD